MPKEKKNKKATNVDTATRNKSDTTLGITRLVLGEELELVVLILKVANVAVTLASEIKAVGSVVPEGHANARNGVERSEAANGLHATRFPESDLPLTHPRKAGSGNAVVLAEPHSAAVFGTLVAGVLVDRLLLPDIPDAELLVSRGSHQHGAISAPRQALHNLGVLQSVTSLPGTDIPQLNSLIAGRRGQDVLGGRVEENMSNFPGNQSASQPLSTSSQSTTPYLECPPSLLTGATSTISSASVWSVNPCGTSQMNTLPSSEAEAMMRSLNGFLVASQTISFRTPNTPRILCAPVGIQHSSSVSTEQRYLVGELAALVYGDDSESTTTTRLPVHGDVLGVDLARKPTLVSFTTPFLSRAATPTLSKLVSQALRLM